MAGQDMKKSAGAHKQVSPSSKKSKKMAKSALNQVADKYEQLQGGVDKAFGFKKAVPSKVAPDAPAAPAEELPDPYDNLKQKMIDAKKKRDAAK